MQRSPSVFSMGSASSSGQALVEPKTQTIAQADQSNQHLGIGAAVEAKDIDAMSLHIQGLMSKPKSPGLRLNKKQPPEADVPTKIMKKPAAKAGAKSVSAKAKPAVKAVKATIGKKTKYVLEYPGIPKKPAAPLLYKNLKVYTDLKAMKWRVQFVGNRKDKAFSWTSDGVGAWQKVNDVLTGKIKIPKD